MYTTRGVRSIRFLSVPLLAWLAWTAALDPIVAPGGAEARGSKAQIVISRADSVPGKAFEIVGRVREKTRDPGLTETDEHLEEGRATDWSSRRVSWEPTRSWACTVSRRVRMLIHAG